jgi:serine phosphatase RsbU (regulator of sigma subunit)
MPDVQPSGATTLEVISPDRASRSIPVTEFPFLIGRGADTGNHLQLSDPRISRRCAAIVSKDGGFFLENRGHRIGLFINGGEIQNHSLENGDKITFGLEDSYEIIFRSTDTVASIQGMLTRIGTFPPIEAATGGLGKLNLLLEATSLLHSDLPLDSILSTMVDHAIAITNADRGILLEGDSYALLRMRLARLASKKDSPMEGLAPSQTALRQALAQQSSVITGDLNLNDPAFEAAQSIVAQALRTIVAIPLYAMAGSKEGADSPSKRDHLLGVLYLDSRRPAAFSRLDRQILDAIAVEAASILDNARLVERERQRQRMEQELNIARDIQQALLPHGFRPYSYLGVSGIHTPCHAVGGDYFDVFPLSEERTAILVADVSGKGLGAALLTTMLQGAFTGMTVGTDPVQVFNQLNRFLCEHEQVGRYATMIFGILERSGQFEFINAGHPSPLILRRREVTELYAGGSFPVGLVPEAEYHARKTMLEPGDTLVLFSDGVTEAMDPDEQLFGDHRLREALSGQHDTPLDHLKKTVLESIENFTRGAGQADDVTLLLVRYQLA